MGEKSRRLIVAAFVVFVAGAAQALTFSGLKTNARLLVSDSGTASARYRFTDTQVGELVNECQREAVAAAWPIIKSTNLDLAVGTTYYTLPNAFLAVKRVTWKNRVLLEKTPTNLDQTKEWEAISGTPQNYFVTFASRTAIAIYPYPADTSSTGTVKVEFYAQADEMSAAADVPFNGIREFYSLHHILAYCAAGTMASIDGQGQLSALYFQRYSNGLARLAGVAMSRPSTSPSISPVRDAPGP